MKTAINRLLGTLNLELHGKNYIKKLRNSHPQKDAFVTQQRLVKRARTIFDVGANRGSVTERYTQLYPGATIHAFEPFKEFRKDFQAIHGTNPKVQLVEKALSDKKGATPFFINSSPDTNSLYRSVSIGASSDKACRNIGQTEVDTDTLDHYCQNKGIEEINILKIDTQGSELAILRGGQALLEQHKIALIYTEAYFQPQYEGQPLLYDIANYLKGFNYFLEEIYEPYYNEHHLLWCDVIFTARK